MFKKSEIDYANFDKFILNPKKYEININDFRTNQTNSNDKGLKFTFVYDSGQCQIFGYYCGNILFIKTINIKGEKDYSNTSIKYMNSRLKPLQIKLVCNVKCMTV